MQAKSRLFLALTITLSALPIAAACGGSDGDSGASVTHNNCGSANVPGSQLAACPDGSTNDSALPNDASTRDTSVSDSASDAKADANISLGAPPACTGTLSLDPTFGDGGITTDPSRSASFAGGAVQTDGKYLVVSNDDISMPSSLARYKVDGSIDTTFGTNGGAPTGNAALSSVIVEPSGRIVAAGLAGGPTACILAGFTINGALDTTFGVSGYAPCTYLSPAGGQTAFSYIAQRPNGKIVATGDVYTSVTATDFGLVQYDQNGVPDSTFGNAGLALAGVPSMDTGIGAMLLQPDGKVVIGGLVLQPAGDGVAARQQIVLARFNVDGSLDNGFGTHGIAFPYNLSGLKILGPANFALQSSGDILIAAGGAGQPDDTFTVLRIKANGALDTTFGTNGASMISFLGYGDQSVSVSTYADDSFIMSGTIAITNDGGFPQSTIGVARFAANGAIDTTFGVGGKFLTNITVADQGSYGIAQILQSNGDLFVVGGGNTTTNVVDSLGVLARFACH